MSPGELGGPYTVVGEIGRGGFGVVYLATGQKREQVALKVMPLDAQSESLVARFQREIHVIAAITHANLVRFHAAGRHDGANGALLWMALDYLKGSTLRQLLHERPEGLAIEDALDYCVQVADGLGALHARGVVHRDVKPENVMLLSDDLIKVFDLGIAKVAGAKQTTGT